ncbi:MAG: hypothetical protein H6R00_3700 [Proteobacteria bacterium]|nr:hypothetical protein [Pseudomonadota bacterium]
MKRIRLLPLVLIAVSALLAVKVLGFVMGVEPFAVGPRLAVASGSEAAGHGEAAAPPAAGPDTSTIDRLTAPIDLADEYKKLKAKQDKAEAAHGAPAEGGNAAAPANGASHEAAPADVKPADGKPTDAKSVGEAPPAADAAHGAGPADAKPVGDAAPAADATHGAAPADGKPAEGAAPASDSNAKSAESGHGAKAKTEVYTERPKEYSPPIGSSERAILEGLALRRDELDKRAQDLDLRAKLLEAAEKRLNERVGAAPAMNEQLASLVSLYEGMKPKAAAAVFDKLDTGTLLELAGHMNPRKLSPIMAAMDPDKASRITGLMVGAQQAQKRVVVQVEQMAPALGPLPDNGGGAPADASQLPQIMPAASGQ